MQPTYPEFSVENLCLNKLNVYGSVCHNFDLYIMANEFFRKRGHLHLICFLAQPGHSIH